MRDVIQKVVATEAEARQLVQAARNEADQLLSGARLQARALVERAHQEVRGEAERIIVAAEKVALQEKTERLARAAVEIKNNIALDETAAWRVADAALRCVCGFSFKEREFP